MSGLQFNSIKDNLNKTCEEVLNRCLEGKVYNKKETQSWTNKIADEIIKNLNAQKRGFKFICNSTIFQKGDACLNFSSTCLWNPASDGSLTFKWENESMHCFICLFGVAP
jgi:dynein light chain Tctex-type 1